MSAPWSKSISTTTYCSHSNNSGRKLHGEQTHALRLSDIHESKKNNIFSIRIYFLFSTVRTFARYWRRKSACSQGRRRNSKSEGHKKLNPHFSKCGGTSKRMSVLNTLKLAVWLCINKHIIGLHYCESSAKETISRFSNEQNRNELPNT